MEENTKVYAYYACSHDLKSDGFLEDRGITFAATLGEAIHKVINAMASDTEEVVHVNVFETDYNINDDTFSAYTLLADFNERKNVMARELQEWCII